MEIRAQDGTLCGADVGLKRHNKGQPFNGVILSPCELVVYEQFRMMHKHPKVADAILEEDCCGGSMYRLRWEGSNIGHSWYIYCYGCKQEQYLGKNCGCA